jgi:hypothetical protein
MALKRTVPVGTEFGEHPGYENAIHSGSCTIRLGSSFPQGSETMASEMFG